MKKATVAASGIVSLALTTGCGPTSTATATPPPISTATATPPPASTPTATPSPASTPTAIPPPHGYRAYYYHDFAASGLSGWQVQQGSTAPASVGASGLAITVTKANQVTEVISDDALLVPGSFIRARVYLPAAKAKIASFPALWGVSTAPSEIDVVEGLAGLACSHTHYLHADTSERLCAPAGSFTGWHIFSALWRGGQVTFWYDSTLEGTLPLPVTAHQRLLFQNRSRSSYCPSCYGPAVYPSADRLAWVKVWHEQA